MTEAHKKYLKAAIITAISMAGVGAFVRNWKAKKNRKKIEDVENGSNTIVIPISEDDFIRDIQTPEEREKDMEGKITEEENSPSKSVGSFGRTFNFFNKNAEVGKSAVREGKSDKLGMPVNEKIVTEEKIDGKTVFRGQDGKFVSKTDPVSVMNVEKTAGMGFIESLLHPIDFAKSVGQSFVDDPLWMTGGAVGSIILANKIVDYLAKERKRKSEKRVEEARKSYVSLLENGDGNEKTAQVDVPGVTGAVLGTAFFLPMALTAMVANKIIENREAERKKKKSLSNSYPQDPIFLYNVVGGEKVAMSPERALSLMMFKTAMFSMCEDNEIEKSAQNGFGSVIRAVVNTSPLMYGAARAAGSIPGVGVKDDEAHKRILGILGDEKNSARLLDIIRMIANGDRRGASAAISNLVYDNDPIFAGRLLASGYEEGPKRRGVENAIYSSPELSNIVAKRFTDENYKDTYGSFADEMIGKKLGLKQGSFLHKIVLWLMNLFGIRNGMIRGEVGKQMSEIQSGLSTKYNGADTSGEKVDIVGDPVKTDQIKNLSDGTKNVLDDLIVPMYSVGIGGQQLPSWAGDKKTRAVSAKTPVRPQKAVIPARTESRPADRIVPTPKSPEVGIMTPAKAVRDMSNIGMWMYNMAGGDKEE